MLVVRCKLIEVHYVTKCGHCNAINHYYVDNIDDNSSVDPDGITCWKCNKESFYDSAIAFHEATCGLQSGQKLEDLTEDQFPSIPTAEGEPNQIIFKEFTPT